MVVCLTTRATVGFPILLFGIYREAPHLLTGM